MKVLQGGKEFGLASELLLPIVNNSCLNGSLVCFFGGRIVEESYRIGEGIMKKYFLDL